MFVYLTSYVCNIYHGLEYASFLFTATVRPSVLFLRHLQRTSFTVENLIRNASKLGITPFTYNNVAEIFIALLDNAAESNAGRISRLSELHMGLSK